MATSHERKGCVCCLSRKGYKSYERVTILLRKILSMRNGSESQVLKVYLGDSWRTIHVYSCVERCNGEDQLLRKQNTTGFACLFACYWSNFLSVLVDFGGIGTSSPQTVHMCLAFFGVLHFKVMFCLFVLVVTRALLQLCRSRWNRLFGEQTRWRSVCGRDKSRGYYLADEPEAHVYKQNQEFLL